MTVETLQMLSTVAYVLAGIFLLAAIAGYPQRHR